MFIHFKTDLVMLHCRLYLWSTFSCICRIMMRKWIKTAFLSKQGCLPREECQYFEWKKHQLFFFFLRFWPILWLNWLIEDEESRPSAPQGEKIGQCPCTGEMRDKRDLSRSFSISSRVPWALLLLWMHFCKIINLPIFQNFIKLKAF